MYKDSKMLNDKRVMTLLVIVEPRVPTGSLDTIPEVHKLFNLHRFN